MGTWMGCPICREFQIIRIISIRQSFAGKIRSRPRISSSMARRTTFTAPWGKAGGSRVCYGRQFLRRDGTSKIPWTTTCPSATDLLQAYAFRPDMQATGSSGVEFVVSDQADEGAGPEVAEPPTRRNGWLK
jgi:hypothetical protein